MPCSEGWVVRHNASHNQPQKKLALLVLPSSSIIPQISMTLWRRKSSPYLLLSRARYKHMVGRFYVVNTWIFMGPKPVNLHQMLSGIWTMYSMSTWQKLAANFCISHWLVFWLISSLTFSDGAAFGRNKVVPFFMRLLIDTCIITVLLHGRKFHLTAKLHSPQIANVITSSQQRE
jgi:hypothetical protein